MDPGKPRRSGGAGCQRHEYWSSMTSLLSLAWCHKRSRTRVMRSTLRLLRKGIGACDGCALFRFGGVRRNHAGDVRAGACQKNYPNMSQRRRYPDVGVHRCRGVSQARRVHRQAVLAGRTVTGHAEGAGCTGTRGARPFITCSGWLWRLLQLGVFRLGFLQDRDVGVGVLPQCEEILIRGTGFGRVALP